MLTDFRTTNERTRVYRLILFRGLNCPNSGGLFLTLPIDLPEAFDVVHPRAHMLCCYNRRCTSGHDGVNVALMYFHGQTHTAAEHMRFSALSDWQ